MSLASSDWAKTSLLGDQFSDVKLIRTGSRFTIYEAREPAAHRPVVIKVPDETSASWLHDALDHEAAILATLGTHPHVITLYQRIVLDDGRPALVLERCTGSLDDSLHGDQRVALQRRGRRSASRSPARWRPPTTTGCCTATCARRNVLVTEWGEPALAGFDESVRIDAGRALRAAARHDRRTPRRNCSRARRPRRPATSTAWPPRSTSSSPAAPRSAPTPASRRPR